jgi:putative metal-binding protein
MVLSRLLRRRARLSGRLFGLRRLLLTPLLVATCLLVACGHGAVADPFGSAARGGAGGEAGAEAGGSGDQGGEPGALGEECSDDTQCDDGIDCTADHCDLARGRCRHVTDDVPCDDGVYCNGVERCTLTLGCQPGAVVSCSDNSVCSIDTCVEETQSCRHEPRDADGDGDPPLSCQGTDCDDFDPLVSGTAHERCDNGRDDDCDGEVDESDCVRPLFDRCSDALDITDDGSYALSTVGAQKDYAISCEASSDDRAFREIVVAVIVPDGGPLDVDLAASLARAKPKLEPGELVLAATDQCGKAASEVACEPSVVVPAGDGVARLVLRNLAPGAHAVYVASDREADIELHVDFRDPEALPSNETCGTSSELSPDVPVRAVLSGLSRDLETQCQSATGDLVYRFELGEAHDVRLQAVGLDAYGTPVISLRDAACTAAEDELTCRSASPASLFVRALPAGTYTVALSGTGPTEAELVLSLAPPTKVPSTEGCADPPVLAAGVTRDVTLDQATDAVGIGCLVGAADATYAVELAERSDLLVVQTGSDGDTGAVLIASAPCDSPGDAATCRSSDQWPVRAVAHGLGPGSVRAVVETTQSKPTSITAFTRPAASSVFVQAADECSDAFVIPADGGRFEGNTDNQYAEYDVSCDYGGGDPGGAPDQFLRLDLEEPRRVVVDASGSNYETIVVLRRADACPGEEIADSCSVTYTAQSGDAPTFSFIDAELEAGSYFIQIEVFTAQVNGDQGS